METIEKSVLTIHMLLLVQIIERVKRQGLKTGRKKSPGIGSFTGSIMLTEISFRFYLTSSKLSLNLISSDDAPIIRSKSPGSATHCNC